MNQQQLLPSRLVAHCQHCSARRARTRISSSQFRLLLATIFLPFCLFTSPDQLDVQEPPKVNSLNTNWSSSLSFPG
jgi:hypothetical protein